jgi:hypothetical protein
MELHWIPAHHGVEGNEVVDKLAKEATGWRGKGKGVSVSETEDPSQLSAAKQSIRSLIDHNWKLSWQACLGGSSAELKRYIQRPHKNTVCLHKGLTKAISSLTTQMRTKIALKDLLFRYGAKESPACSCRSGRQTARYILLSCTCPLFDEDRARTWSSVPLNLTSILSNKPLAIKTAKFMIRTQLLKVFESAKTEKPIKEIITTTRMSV